MTPRELALDLYRYADAQALAIFLVSLAWPLFGTLLTRVGKAGHSASDGLAIANLTIGGAVAWLLLAVLAMAVAKLGFARSVFDASLLLLLAPVVCVAASVLGIRWVFPLNQLASMRTLIDIGLFLAAGAALLWLLSRFRGWGIVFVSGLGGLLVLGALALVLLRVLYRRARGG